MWDNSQQYATQAPKDVYHELEKAVYDLSSRGLHQAARWAAEQISGLDPGLLQEASNAAQSGNVRPLQTDSVDRAPQFLLAKQHFEFKEYRRAASVLTGLSGPKPLFFKCWCLYLAGEKRKEEERDEQQGDGKSNNTADGLTSGVADPHARINSGGVLLLGAAKGGGATSHNQELAGIEACLRESAQQGVTDPFCTYLLGVVMLDRGSKAQAQELLLQSVREYPANWSAWLALQRLVVDAHSLTVLPSEPNCLPLTHWATDFFIASSSLELQGNMEALSRLQRLSQLFPQSLTVEGMVAQAHYNLQNFEEAQVLFEDLLARDPYRLEGTDTFSNILFVKEQPAALSMLAHRAMTTDKFRPETCCVVGNYYSLKGNHELAVMWFRRALRLQRTCLAAWTLMGHEYMEMKNTAAAIEAYRSAVELCSHDYRAWYGLGQAHELLKLPYYALYYYRRAAALRPDDARMWCALGQCYASEQVGNQDMAVRCYQRAVDHQDPEGIALHLLAKLREQRGEMDEAERLYRADLARLDAEGAAGGPGGVALSQDAADALLFLAGHCKATGRLNEAKAYCERLMDVGGPPREHAKALAREIAALQSLHRGMSQGIGVAGVPGTAGGGGGDGNGTSSVRHARPAQSSVAQHGSHETPSIVHHVNAQGADTAAGGAGRGGGRNLFSALGMAWSSQVSGPSQRQQQRQGLVSPLPAPMFGGGTPISRAAPLFAPTPGTVTSGQMTMDFGQSQTPATPLSAQTIAMSDASTPPTARSHQAAGPGMQTTPGFDGPGFGPTSTTPHAGFAQTGQTSGGPAWQAQGFTGGSPDQAMDMGTPMLPHPQGDGQQQVATTERQSQNVQGESRQDARSAARASDAVQAVSQQLRVEVRYAQSLLEAAGGDPIRAIRSNLHLLGPALQ